MDISLIIIICIIVGLILFIILRPYVIKYDSTLCFTGGLGAGKTRNGVSKAKLLIKKMIFMVKKNNFINKQLNKIIRFHNKRAVKYNKKHCKDAKPKMRKIWKERIDNKELPRLFSNIPILLNKRKQIYSNVVTKEMIMLQEKIPEYSVVFIDELPQMINQFNWSIKDVQNNVNEFITFFRHYIGGYFIVTAQSIDDVVAQIRRKLNTYYWLFDFKPFLHFFYKVRICQFQSSDIVSNVNQGFIEDNAKMKYGIFKKDYDSRCYSERYDILKESTYHRFARKKTKRIIRFSKYKSPLDTETEEQDKK